MSFIVVCMALGVFKESWYDWTNKLMPGLLPNEVVSKFGLNFEGAKSLG
jgi:hypothetical protein